MDVFAWLALAAGALARADRPSKGWLAAPECLGGFHIRAVFFFAREIAGLHSADFPGAGHHACVAIFLRRTRRRVNAPVGLATLSGEFAAFARDFPSAGEIRFP